MNRHCLKCGAAAEFRIPEGDQRERLVCLECGFIFYQNPAVVVTTLAMWEDQVLLCQRAIEPSLGKWCLPGGFLERGETLEEGAIREMYEETFAEVQIERLFAQFTLRHIGTLMFCFLGQLKRPVFQVGPECLDVQLFSWKQLEATSLAFPSHTFALEEFRRDPDSAVIRSRSYDRD
jgi:ADP-ribose pyrophosphatase YjhB (NUDIX family)